MVSMLLIRRFFHVKCVSFSLNNNNNNNNNNYNDNNNNNNNSNGFIQNFYKVALNLQNTSA